MSAFEAEVCEGVVASVDTGKPASRPLYHPHVKELYEWILADKRRELDFEDAIKTALSHNLPEFAGWTCLKDYLSFLTWVIRWVPSETVDGTEIFRQFSKVYFIFSQSQVLKYQNAIVPRSTTESLTWLSAWIVAFGQHVGAHMDEVGSISASTMSTFRASPKFRINDYDEPPGSWLTFNAFFARHVKPGARPIAFPRDPGVVTSPADMAFVESHRVSLQATIEVKTVSWTVAELLGWNPHAKSFAGGTVLHGFLGSFDYHRMHAPLAGRVIHAGVVSGAHYTQIEIVEVPDGESKAERGGPAAKHRQLRKKRVLDCPNDWGYQFSQARGLVILETEMGLVALVAVGMAVVSSVKLSVKDGDEVEKGDEVGYFQFGGSDLIVLFEKDLQVTAGVCQHYLMGQAIARVKGVKSKQERAIYSRLFMRCMGFVHRTLKRMCR